jgi:hypothetical protein
MLSSSAAAWELPLLTGTHPTTTQLFSHVVLRDGLADHGVGQSLDRMRGKSMKAVELAVSQRIVGEKVRRDRRWISAGEKPPGNWFAPPGSNDPLIHKSFGAQLSALGGLPPRVGTRMTELIFICGGACRLALDDFA